MPGGGNLVRSTRYRKKPRTPQSAHARYYYTRSLVLESNKRKSLNVARCQSAPRVMDSHSRSASPRDSTAARPQHRPPSPPPTTPPAFDNRAYQHDEDHNHNDSFTSQQQNGHSKDQPNGTQTKTPEAVNLELINLTPKNGSKKKDVEVDMNATNPYDEYFVPVNEHRKYMRGEKLYVTADKRGEKGGCKRPLCWTLFALVAAVVIALIVLAATGILFTTAPTPLDQFNSSSISSARAFGGIGAHEHSAHEDDRNAHEHNHIAHDLDNEQDHVTHDHSGQDNSDPGHVEPTPIAEPSPKEETKVPTTQTKLDLPVSDESAEATMYVPRTLEGEMKIDNEEYIEELGDPESEEFRNFNYNFGNALKKALFDRDTLDNGNNKIYVEVISVRPGSLLVTYRIHWIPKTNTEVPEDVLTANSLRMALDNYLDTNNRMISVFHVAEDKMSTRQVLDLCHLNKNDCEYGCSFEETSLDFMCTCPRGEIIDMSNAKKCTPILESNIDSMAKPVDVTKQKGYRVLDFGTEGTITKQVPDEEKPRDNFDWKSSEEAAAETTTNAAAEYKYSHVFGNGSEQSTKHEPTAEPEPKPEPEPPAQSDPNVQVKLVTPVPEPEPTAQPEPEPIAQPEPEPTAQPDSEPSPQPQPEPSAEPASQPQSEPSAEPEPDSKTEHSTEPESTGKPEPESSGEHESITKLEPEPFGEPEPTTKPEFESSAEPEPTIKPEPELSVEPEPTAKPESESSAEPEPITPHERPSKHQSSASLETSAELEPTSEPEPKSEAKLQQIIDSEDNPVNQFKTKTELSAEPLPTTIQPETEMIKRNEMQSVTSEPEVKPLWEYKPVIEKNTFLDEMQKNHKIFTMSEQVPEAENTTEAAKMSQETFLMDHLYSGESKKQDKITTVETILNEKTNKEPEEIRPDVLSIYENLNKNEKRIDLKSDEQEQLKYTENNINETTTSKNYMEFVEEDIKLDDIKQLTQNSSMLPETTTPASISISSTKSVKPDEDISFDLITKQEETTGVTEKQTKSQETENGIIKPEEAVEVEHATTTTSTQSTISTSLEETKPTYMMIDTNNTSNTNIPTTEYINFALPVNKSDTVIALESNNSSVINEEQIDSEYEKTFNTVLKDSSQNITSTLVPIKENTTMITELIPSPEHVTTTEYSISKDYQPNKIDGIVEFLENHTKSTEITTTSSTEKGTSEATEITFDAINTLFNRSSKSIEEGTHASRNETTETTTEPKLTTTPSDWLSESVTEINYKDLMLETKSDKLTTTDQPLTKIEEMINKGYTKDDFEPEYLNISPTKGPDREEPFYGMVHNDYDSEDLRVKRVNSVKEIPVIAANSTFGENKSSGVEISSTTTTTKKDDIKITENASMISFKPKKPENSSTNITKTESRTADNSSHVTSDQIESTTINQYIYKSTANVRDEPAPVWEKEDEPVSVLQISTTSQINSRNIKESETNLMSTEKVNEETTTNMPSEDENQKGSTTQVNNLNVTIYEIPGHNHSFTTSKSTAHSTEYEDHETEMNPFLPEVENNKSLVKKLQEGHDLIEPVSVNETQNENAEEHSVHYLVQTNNETSITTEKSLEGGTRTNEDESTFNELNNDNYNSPEVDTNVPESNGKPENAQEKGGPVVTFLQDTDDLDVIRVHTSEATEIISDTTVIPATVVSQASNEDSDYLSVVPIVEERREEKETLRKTYINGGIQKLNDISDSPKKSDRRTLDASKLDSVNNNET